MYQLIDAYFIFVSGFLHKAIELQSASSFNAFKKISQRIIICRNGSWTIGIIYNVGGIQTNQLVKI